jgi:acetyl esterase
MPDPAQRLEITALPLRARVDELRGLPPTLIITAEIDVLRDEGEQYASMLRASGVDVLATRYLATVHGFCHLAALRDTPAAEAVIDQAATFLRRAADTRHGQ